MSVTMDVSQVAIAPYAFVAVVEFEIQSLTAVLMLVVLIEVRDELGRLVDSLLEDIELGRLVYSTILHTDWPQLPPRLPIKMLVMLVEVMLQ